MAPVIMQLNAVYIYIADSKVQCIFSSFFPDVSNTMATDLGYHITMPTCLGIEYL